MSVAYSFVNLSGAFSHPLAGTFALVAGELGIGQITITMSTVRTQQDVTADGYVGVSALPGDNGVIEIEMVQNCSLHGFLLGWANDCITAQRNLDTSNWATATISMMNVVDGSSHQANGVSMEKIPDHPYAAALGRITWRLMAAEIINQ